MDISNLNKIDVKKIITEGRQVVLQHATKNYLLSITRRGKLILTSAEASKKT